MSDKHAIMSLLLDMEKLKKRVEELEKKISQEESKKLSYTEWIQEKLSK